MSFTKTPLIIAVATAALVAALCAGCAANNAGEVGSAPQKAPSLDVIIAIGDSQQQRIQAAQLTNGWDADDGSSYEADSFHPLQMPGGYSDATLFLSAANGGIALQFSNSYPPMSVSVQRWDAMLAGTDSVDVWDNGEPVPISTNAFGIDIDNDGNDYIYEVHAYWKQGYSLYSFRVNTADIAMNINNINANGLSFSFENASEKQYFFGSGYSLLALTGGSWHAVEPIIENWGFNDVGYELKPQSKTDAVSVDWSWLYGELPGGDYKFQKEVYLLRPGDNDTYVLEQPFSVNSSALH